MATKKWVGTDTGNEGDWATAANWSPSGVPTNGDDVYFVDSSQNVVEGFAQSAIVLSSLVIDQSFTGQIGDVDEYLVIGIQKLFIGQHQGPGSPAGSGRLKIDMRDVALTATVAVIENSGTSTESNKPPIQLLFNKNTSTLEVRKGKVGVAYNTGETSSLATIIVSYLSSKESDSDVYIGSGVTLVTLTTYGGETYLNCAVTTLNGYGGSVYTYGTGAITTVNGYGATIISNSTGTITTCNIDDGTVDFTQSSQARTVTTLTLDKPGKLKYDPGVMTLTNKIVASNKVILTAS